MRIVFDVSPLSHPLTGIGNYVRGSLGGLVEAAGGQHELVAFAPTSPAGRKAIPRALEGLDVELTLVPLPLSQRWRDAWSRLGRPALERFLGRFDVFHYSDWMYPPQAGGVRATTVHDLVPLRFPEWVTPKTAAMHGAKYAHTARTADLVFVNSEYTGRDVVERLGVGSQRVKVAYPGVKEAFRADGERADLGRPYVLTVATLEPRKNLETLIAAHRLLGEEFLLAVAGGTGWGDQPELRPRTSSGSVSSPTTSSRASTAGPPSPSIPPASRASACRSPRRWRAGRPRWRRRTPRWTRRPVRLPCAPTRTTPRRSPPPSETRSSGGTSSFRPASRRLAASRGARRGAFLAGYLEASA